jgi:hypothetical protein
MAPRFVRFNPKEIKHVVEDEHAQERTHPVFTSLPEQLATIARELEDMPVGHCYIKFGSRVQRLVTTPYPMPRVTYQDLAPITERFAQQYLVPLPTESTPLTASVQPVSVFEPRMLKERVLADD